MEINSKFIKHVEYKFWDIMTNNNSFKYLMFDIFTYGTAYAVGGFIRDVIFNVQSRDIDIIVDINHKELLNILENASIEYELNRHNGIKVRFDNIIVDFWSIENNWAFKNELVKLNENDKLNCIAKGCFYNYDALVTNLHTFNFNIKYFRDFTKSNVLDILQKSPLYKSLNPTIEANILRAFYLRKVYNIQYSQNTKLYLIRKLGHLEDMSGNKIKRLLETLQKYQKYQILSQDLIENYMDELLSDSAINNQFLINF